MFLSTDNVDFIKGNDSEKGKDDTPNDTLNDIIKAEFNYNKKDDQRQYINNVEYFKNLIIGLHEQISA